MTDLAEFLPRISVFLGDFGSGKTELAMNYARALVQEGRRTAVVDLDLVKPYFRTREARVELEASGVWVVAPAGRFAHADLPILPGELLAIFERKEYRVVIDVGGNEGAVVLGQLRKYFLADSYEACLVINTNRPFTRTEEDISAVMADIERVARLKVASLVSNTNLGRETTLTDVTRGYAIVRQLAARINLPVKWVVVPTWLAEDAARVIDAPLFVVEPMIKYPWMD